MRRAVLALVATVTVLVLLLGYKTSHRPATGRLAALPSATPAPAPTSGRAGPTPTATTARGRRTLTGQAASTPYGPVQVRVTFTAGVLTSVAAVRVPNDNPTSQQLSGYAAPILAREAVAARSARIDVVSGATYTSDGYAQSLQSTLDRAHG